MVDRIQVKRFALNGGINKSVEPYNIGDNELADGSNFLCSLDSLETVRKNLQVSEVASAATHDSVSYTYKRIMSIPFGDFTKRIMVRNKTVAGDTKSYLGRWSELATNDQHAVIRVDPILRVAGAIWGPTSTYYYTTQRFNGDNGLKSITTSGTSAYSATPFTGARFLSVFNGHLMAFGVWDSSTNSYAARLNRVVYSDYLLPTTFVGGLAGFFEIANETAIMNVLPMRNYLIIYTTSGLYSMSYVGYPLMFSPQKIVDNVGSMLSAGVSVDNYHIFIAYGTNKSVYVFDGSTAYEIGQKVKPILQSYDTFEVRYRKDSNEVMIYCGQSDDSVGTGDLTTTNGGQSSVTWYKKISYNLTSKTFSVAEIWDDAIEYIIMDENSMSSIYNDGANDYVRYFQMNDGDTDSLRVLTKTMSPTSQDVYTRLQRLYITTQKNSIVAPLYFDLKIGHGNDSPSALESDEYLNVPSDEYLDLDLNAKYYNVELNVTDSNYKILWNMVN